MCLYPKYIKGQYFACRKCIECRILYSSQWAFRCMLEAKQYADNCFITLTYNNEHLPANGSLCKKDLQKFFKRLRKVLDEKYNTHIRYFACGEYGSKYKRPHYHCIVFGWKPFDLEYLTTTKKGEKIYRSRFLEQVWSIVHKKNKKKTYESLGFVSVGELNYNSAKYTAKYLQKPVPDNLPLEKPFILSSRRPGIGFDSINGDMVFHDKIYVDGKSCRLPDSFIAKLEKQGVDLSIVKDKRKRSWNAYMYCEPWRTIPIFMTPIYFYEINERIEKFNRIFPNLSLKKHEQLPTKKYLQNFIKKLLTGSI